MEHFWWHALLFTALSAPFSLVLSVFLWLSVPPPSLSFAPFWRLCLQFWHERLPPPPPLTLWVTAQRQKCPLLDFYWLLISEKNTGAWNADRTIPGLAGAVREESWESFKFVAGVFSVLKSTAQSFSLSSVSCRFEVHCCANSLCRCVIAASDGHIGATQGQGCCSPRWTKINRCNRENRWKRGSEKSFEKANFLFNGIGSRTQNTQRFHTTAALLPLKINNNKKDLCCRQ